MALVDFSPLQLKSLERIGVRYTTRDGSSKIIDTSIVFLSDNNLTVSFSGNKDFKPDCPQDISLKYVLNNEFCSADTILSDIKSAHGLTYFIIQYPEKVSQVNRRKYYRISMRRACVLIVTDEDGNSKSYMSRLVDISIGGLLIHKLESMFSDEYVKIEPSKYKYFNVVLFLDIDVVLKLSARYIREEKGRVSYRYAFEFTDIKQTDIDMISKYVTKEQIRQRKNVSRT